MQDAQEPLLEVVVPEEPDELDVVVPDEPLEVVVPLEPDDVVVDTQFGILQLNVVLF